MKKMKDIISQHVKTADNDEIMKIIIYHQNCKVKTF